MAEFERDAIAPPPSIAAGDSAVIELYRDVVLSGAGGITLADLRDGVSVRGLRTEEVHRLRVSGCVAEREESRSDGSGRRRTQVVLYARS